MMLHHPHYVFIDEQPLTRLIHRLFERQLPQEPKSIAAKARDQIEMKKGGGRPGRRPAPKRF